MPTIAQNLTDLFLLPFHLTLFFALAPFRVAKWGVRTGREWTLWGFSLIPSARKHLTHELETAQRKSSVPKQETQKPLPTVASLPSKAEKKVETTESESKSSSSSIYDDFLSGLKHSLETVKDPQARAGVMKRIVESAQATAMEATNMLGQQSKSIEEMESASEQLHQAYSDQSFKLQESGERYHKLKKEYQQMNSALATAKKELKESHSKIQDLEKRYAEEKKQHENALKGDRIILLKMEKDLIQERQKRAEIQERMQMSNLELVDLVVREEQKRRKDNIEATALKEAIAIEEEVHKALESQSQAAESKTDSESPSEPEAPHEFDPSHFSYKDAVVEHVQPVHHEFNTKVLSFKDAVLEPAYEEPLQNQAESHSQASF